MNRIVVLIVLAVAVTFLGVDRLANARDALNRSESFQCGSNIVSIGDAKVEVLIRCGKPTYQESAGSKGTVRRGQQGEPLDYEAASKTVEKWYYNRGPNDFIYELTFIGGTLRSIKTRGYGK